MQGFAMPEEVYSLITPGGLDPNRVKGLWQQAVGPLPISQSVNIERANQLWFIHGTLYSGSTGIKGILLRVDGVDIYNSEIFINTINQHHAVAMTMHKSAFGVGTHTVALVAGTGSPTTDSGDRFTLYMIELENTQELVRIDSRPLIVTSLPTLPEHGQEVYYKVDDDTIWHLKYDSTISDAYKWRVVGGSPPMRAFTAGTGESTGSGTYTTLASATSLTLPLKGIYDFWWHLESFANAAAVTSTALQIINNGVGETLGSTVPGDYDAARVGTGTINNGWQGTGSRRGTVTALPASARLVHRTTAGTATFQLRHLHASPVRVG